MSAWVAWAVLAVLLTVGEIFTPGLFFLGPIALAAVAATIAAAAGAAVWAQVLIFGLEGAHALVLQQVDGRGGRVKIGGEEWSARSYVPDEVFEAGTEVEVAQIQGATALVYR